MTDKLSFEDWKKSNEVSYDIHDDLLANTSWAKVQNKSVEELKDTLLRIVYQDYLEQNH